MMAKLKDTTNQPLSMPPLVDDLQMLATNQVGVTRTHGTATNASEIFVGQWNMLAIGLRTGFTIELLRERYVENWQYAIAAHIRADIQPLDIKAFAAVTGIIP